MEKAHIHTQTTDPAYQNFHSCEHSYTRFPCVINIKGGERKRKTNEEHYKADCMVRKEVGRKKHENRTFPFV